MSAQNPYYLSSLDHDAIAPYRTLRRPAEHRKLGLFVGEGEKVVRSMVAGSIEIVSFLMTKDWYSVLFSSEEGFRRTTAAVYISNEGTLEEIVGHRLHQGLMAVGKVPDDPLLEKLPGLTTGGALYVALDHLSRAENVGTVVRNCAAFGVHALLVGEGSVSPYMRRAVRNSIGTVFAVGVHHTDNLVQALRYLHDHGVAIIGADPGGSMNLQDFEIEGSTCLVLGNEGEGISAEVLRCVDQQVAIPMKRGADSLNVGSASAVFLHELTRNRPRG